MTKGISLLSNLLLSSTLFWGYPWRRTTAHRAGSGRGR